MLFLINNTIESQNGFNFLDFFTQIGLVGQLVLLVLIFFSVVSWGIIFYKWKVINSELKKSKKFIIKFYRTKNIKEKYRIALRFRGRILPELFRAAYEEASNQVRFKNDKKEPVDIESIERAMFFKINEGIEHLEKKLSFLATTASATPFIGLFGTVWGIMNAFREIGLQGSADLATVAPGISEALINTAAGLFAAIPAVVAYNFLLKKVKETSTLAENFSMKVANIFQKVII